MSRICPICGEEYSEPPALSRTDDVTPICSSCGVRQALQPLVDAGAMKQEDMEKLIWENKELYHRVDGT